MEHKQQIFQALDQLTSQDKQEKSETSPGEHLLLSTACPYSWIVQTASVAVTQICRSIFMLPVKDEGSEFALCCSPAGSAGFQPHLCQVSANESRRQKAWYREKSFSNPSFSYFLHPSFPSVSQLLLSRSNLSGPKHHCTRKTSQE